MVTDEVIPPSSLTCVAQTFAPVSALTENTQPSFEAMNMQPSAIVGVPVKSPEPPADEAENVQAGESSAASTGPIVFSAGWVRLFDRSCPYDGQSPPACFTGAHCAPPPADDGSASSGSSSTAPASAFVSLVNLPP